MFVNTMPRYEILSADAREELLPHLDPETLGEILSELDTEIREEVLEHVPSATLAKAIGEMESDDAADVVDDLEADKRAEVMAAMPEVERAAIETTLAYEDETAGRLMQREVVAAPQFWTAGQAIDHRRTVETCSTWAMPYSWRVASMSAFHAGSRLIRSIDCWHVSRMSARYFSTCSTMSFGTSLTSKFSGTPESSQMYALRVSRSTTPENPPSLPIGSTITSRRRRVAFSWRRCDGAPARDANPSWLPSTTRPDVVVLQRCRVTFARRPTRNDFQNSLFNALEPT